MPSIFTTHNVISQTQHDTECLLASSMSATRNVDSIDSSSSSRKNGIIATRANKRMHDRDDGLKVDSSVDEMIVRNVDLINGSSSCCIGMIATRAKGTNDSVTDGNKDDGIMVDSSDGAMIKNVDLKDSSSSMVDSSNIGISSNYVMIDNTFDGIDAATVMANMNSSIMNDNRNTDKVNIDSSDDEMNKTFEDYSLDVDKVAINSVVNTLSKSINIISSDNTKIVDGSSDGIYCKKMRNIRAKPSDKAKETKR